ncbi:hypothetical protein SAMN05444157_1093 [Frankineae bacterium MT45]|nr:hypothetical protein SAMN05444157_1093 [Frankineae bacterium MT45]
MPNTETSRPVQPPVHESPAKTGEKSRLGLSATQIVASAITAVLATVAASYLGISGTVVGAAVASVLTVTGNAVFGHSLRRTTEVVREVVPITVTRDRQARANDYTLTDVPPVHPLPANDESIPALSHSIPDETAQATTSTWSGVTTTEKAKPRWWSTLEWRHAAIATLAIFSALMIGVTGFEIAAHRPLAAVVQGERGSGTSLSGGSTSTKSTPAPTVTPSTATPTATTAAPTSTEATPSPALTPSATPAATPSPTPVSATPTPAPAASPTTAPVAAAPSDAAATAAP